MSRKNIWMDCDPGIDDAVALAMAAASHDSLMLWGISTVAGNQTSRHVTDNALKLCAFLGLNDVPVVRGAQEPLIRRLEVADDIHGTTGLGNCVLPETSKKTASDSGILFLRDCILNLPPSEKMTLVPTAPLTNIALLLKTFPEVKEHIDQIVLMGGSSTEGNVTPFAEFNIWTDPEAAQIVFHAGIPIVMCGLDVTHCCGLDRHQVQELQDSKDVVKCTYGQMLRFYFDCTEYQNNKLVCIHDAVTILYLTNPQLFDGIGVSVEVDCTYGNHRGRTVCRPWQSSTEKAPVLMLNSVDLPAFQQVLLRKLSWFSQAGDL
nr:nucleoside hydrolase [uncultured Solibaculum sp.]